MTREQRAVCGDLLQALTKARSDFLENPDYIISWTSLRRLSKPLGLSCAGLKFLFLLVSENPGISDREFREAVLSTRGVVKCAVR